MSQHAKHDRAARDPIAIMDGLLDDVAEQAAEDLVDHDATDDSIRWARELGAKVQRQLARLERRRPRTTPGQSSPRDVTIPAAIQALDRESLLARLEILSQIPGVQIAHQELSGLSDNDLRRTLVHLLISTERQ